MNTQSLHGHRWPLFASLIGLALAANYTWQFETEYFNLYLPLLRK